MWLVGVVIRRYIDILIIIITFPYHRGDLRPVHTAHSMRIQSGLMRIGLRSHCQVMNAH